MKIRWVGGLLAVSTVLLLTLMALTQVSAQPPKEAQAKGKEPQLPSIPSGYENKRENIERGTLETVAYDSKTVGSKRNLVVYLPPGYAKAKKYPVFYLLHGLGGNETDWTKRGSAQNILDNLYADKKIEPMIVVMPNGMVGADGKPAASVKGADYVTGFEKELLSDIMPTAEGRFPIMADADHRAVGGLSMGGGQSLMVALKHLDKFHWIGGFSSAMLQNKGNLVANVEETNKKLKLLYLACGDSPNETLFASNKTLHTNWDTIKVNHVWNVYPEGEHSMVVWRNDLYTFSQLIFKDKK